MVLLMTLAAALFLPVAMRTTPSVAAGTIGTNFGVVVLVVVSLQ